MNKIVRVSENEFVLYCEDGQEFMCSLWYEKKIGDYHVRIPKEGKEICGREFIRLSKFDNTDTYEFETKTEHRTGLSNGGWKSRMTEEERVEYETLEKRMKMIEEVVKSRPVKELTEREKIELQIQRLMAKRDRLDK